MQIMWHATILLHRPFIARWPSNPAAVDSANPLEVCLQAANNICLVLEKYFDRLLGLPCDMIFSVFTAASMLLYQSKQSQDANGENRRRLQLCVHWLSVFGKSWKSAGARHQLLSDSKLLLLCLIRLEPADRMECSIFPIISLTNVPTIKFLAPRTINPRLLNRAHNRHGLLYLIIRPQRFLPVLHIPRLHNRLMTGHFCETLETRRTSFMSLMFSFEVCLMVGLMPLHSTSMDRWHEYALCTEKDGSSLALRYRYG
jgi:hypothetical protein